MAQHDYFPLFFSMENKNIFIIGGGRVAERRIQRLLEFGAEMTVVSPEVTEKIRQLSDEQAVRWIPQCYREAHLCHETDLNQEAHLSPAADLKQEAYLSPAADLNQEVYLSQAADLNREGYPDFVLACTGDAMLNHKIALFCKEKGIPVNNASCKEDSDFYFPALIRHDGLVFGVSSDGSDHKKVRSVCEKIRRLLQNK